VGQIARDLLTNSEQFEIVKLSIAETQRTLLKDEQTARHVEAIETGDQLIAVLSDLASSHEMAAKALSAQIPIDSELREYLKELHYANDIWGLMQTYKRSWSSELEPLEIEYQSIRLQMDAFLKKMPHSPEKSQLGQQLADVLSEISQRTRDQKLNR
jgi:hypothetical protein